MGRKLLAEANKQVPCPFCKRWDMDFEEGMSILVWEGMTRLKETAFKNKKLNPKESQPLSPTPP